MGPQKKRIQSETVNRNTAYHEAGHALIQYFCRSDAKKLHKITILPRGQALGMVSTLLRYVFMSPCLILNLHSYLNTISVLYRHNIIVCYGFVCMSVWCR